MLTIAKYFSLTDHLNPLGFEKTHHHYAMGYLTISHYRALFQLPNKANEDHFHKFSRIQQTILTPKDKRRIYLTFFVAILFLILQNYISKFVFFIRKKQNGNF